MKKYYIFYRTFQEGLKPGGAMVEIVSRKGEAIERAGRFIAENPVQRSAEVIRYSDRDPWRRVWGPCAHGKAKDVPNPFDAFRETLKQTLKK